MRLTPFLASFLLFPAIGIAQETESENLPSALESSYSSLEKKVESVVVSIQCDRKGKKPPAKKSSRFNLSMMDGGVFKYRPTNAPVTGTIVSNNGYILTTYFNIRDGVESLRVELPDGRVLPAKVKGFNATFDLALLQVEAKNLPVLPKAPLNRIRTGQMIIACGRAPDDKKGLTLNPGIVSAPWRMSGRGIQIDSLMNYGNVGGPVVTRSGKFVGISCRVDTKHAGSTGQNSGIGFVVTWDKIDTVLPNLKKGKNVKEVRRPFLGIQANTESEVVGVEIQEVVPASSAEKAGVQAGDVIVEFDGKKIKNFDQLRAAIGSKVPGNKTSVVVRRGDKTLRLELVLGWAPGE